MRFRHSASFGKRQEFWAIAELLRRGYDVYVRLVDDQGTDCVARQGPKRYFDAQIKARSADVSRNNAAFFPELNIATPRENYVFVFYTEGIGERGTYWVIPSAQLARPGISLTVNSGPRKGKCRIKLNNELRPRPKDAAYVDAWQAAVGPPPRSRPRTEASGDRRREEVALK